MKICQTCGGTFTCGTCNGCGVSYASHDRKHKKEHKKRLRHQRRSKPIKRHVKRARDRVKNAIDAGELQKPYTRICEECRQRNAKSYHHYKGYDKANWLQVMALCDPCHRKRDKLDVWQPGPEWDYKPIPLLDVPYGS